jgi:16S rRNA processing protein RimM
VSNSEIKYVPVGRVKDAHGIKGELFIVLFAGEAAWLNKLKEIRLMKPDAPAGQNPEIFPVKAAKIHKNGFIAKTDLIKDRNRAEELKGFVLEIPESMLVSKKGESLYLREVLGFKVFTKAKGEVGTIEAFSTNTAQDLLVVKTSWGTFEIPFVKDFVENIDFEKKEVHLDLPEGLLGEFDGDDEQ